MLRRAIEAYERYQAVAGWAETATSAGQDKPLVWDAPVRVGHWLLVLSVALAWFSAESELWRRVHAFAGGMALGVVVFRIFWGFWGSEPARFRTFLRPWSEVRAYLGALARGQPRHYSSHNPAGGYAVVALLAAVGLASLSGWVAYNDWGGQLVKELHEACAHGLLVVVGVHLIGVVVGSFVHRECLPCAMVHGRKRAAAHEAIISARRWAVPLLLVLSAACGGWLAR